MITLAMGDEKRSSFPPSDHHGWMMFHDYAKDPVYGMDVTGISLVYMFYSCNMSVLKRYIVVRNNTAAARR